MPSPSASASPSPTPSPSVPARGTATLTGSVQGATVANIRSVVAVLGTQGFQIYIADHPDLCRTLQAHGFKVST